MHQVKDRFCSLLSQQVSELQKRLALAKLDLIDGGSQSSSAEVVHVSVCVCVGWRVGGGGMYMQNEW